MAYTFYTGALYSGESRPWITDGTPAGTRELTLADIGLQPGSALNLAAPFIAQVGAEIFFTGTSANGDTGIWVASAGGAEQLLISQPSKGSFTCFKNGSRTFVLTSYASVSNPQGAVWVTDGTPQGTIELSPLHADRSAVAGDKLIFSVNLGGGFNDVWISDGTIGGTSKFTTVWTNSTFAFLPHSDSVSFSGQEATWDTSGVYVADGSEHVWAIDGLPQRATSTPSFDYMLGGSQLFVSGAGHNEIWITDGATGVSHLVYSAAAACALKQVVDGLAYFTVNEDTGHALTGGNSRVDLWATDGTMAWLIDDLPSNDVTSFLREPLNVAPSSVSLSNASVTENASSGTMIAKLSTTGFEKNDTHTFQLLDDADGRFAISGDQLVVADRHALDFEHSKSHVITVRATDQGGLFVDTTLSIAVADVNEAPTSVTLSPSAVAEAAKKGTVVGTLAAVDPDTGDTHTFQLINSAGGRFALQGDKIVVADGLRLDYEQARTHHIVVRDTDAGGRFIDKTLAISLADIVSEYLIGDERPNKLICGAGNDLLQGGGGADRLSGGAGADTLCGNLGRDILTGGAGADWFYFNMTPDQLSIDAVTDFTHGQDRIVLNQYVFTRVGSEGVLRTGFFHAGPKATDSDDYILYNRATGVVLYDADGNGAGEAVRVAVLKDKPALSAADFLVF